MDNKSIFTSSYRILRRNKLAWLLGFIYGLALILAVLLTKNRTGIFLCFGVIAFLFLYITIPLCLLITLYYEYLDQPLTFTEVWKVVRKYIIRLIGLTTLFYLPLLLLYIFLIKLTAGASFIIVSLGFNIAYYFLFTFSNGFIVLSMLQNNLGMGAAIKQGAPAWARWLNIKFEIAVLISVIRVIFEFICLLSQNRSIIKSLTINYHDLITSHNSLLFIISNGFYWSIVLPFTTAILISTFFEGVKADSIYKI
jgi:hypothetical protein